MNVHTPLDRSVQIKERIFALIRRIRAWDVDYRFGQLLFQGCDFTAEAGTGPSLAFIEDTAVVQRLEAFCDRWAIPPRAEYITKVVSVSPGDVGDEAEVIGFVRSAGPLTPADAELIDDLWHASMFHRGDFALRALEVFRSRDMTFLRETELCPTNITLRLRV